MLNRVVHTILKRKLVKNNDQVIIDRQLFEVKWV